DAFDNAVSDFHAAAEAAQGDAAVDQSVLQQLAEELRKTEVLQKRSKAEDYHKILGLERNCSESDIKKAYRRESLKHHPDKGGDEEKFKLVVEANTVL
ncbi:DnaJ domain-containing protein, partial [Auriculariales sp. MPI-PUGE-AT-0066]